MVQEMREEEEKRERSTKVKKRHSSYINWDQEIRERREGRCKTGMKKKKKKEKLRPINKFLKKVGNIPYHLLTMAFIPLWL